MKKKISKKKIGIISSAVAVTCIVGGAMFANANKGEDFIELLREYSVSRGNIVAGFTGSGQLKLNAKEYNFSHPIMLGELLVDPGQAVKAGDPLATIATEELEKQLVELTDELTKAKLNLQKVNNLKEVATLTNELSWNQVTNSSQLQYNNEKSGLESQMKQLENQLASVVNDINMLQDQINNFQPEEEPIPQPEEEQTEQPEGEQSEETKALEEVNRSGELEPTPQRVSTMELSRTGNQSQLDQLNEQLVMLKEQEATIKAQLDQIINSLNVLNDRRAQQLNQEKDEAASNKKINDKTLQDYDASIQLAKMEVEKIEEEISNIQMLKETNTLVADVDGIVTSVGYTPNTMTSIDKPVITLGTLDQVTAELSVSQNDVNKLKEGQVVQLEVNAFPGETLMGKVKSINYMPVNEGGSIVYKVTVELDPTGRALQEGMTVNAKFIIKEVKDVLTLSNKAIMLQDGLQMVKVKHEDGTIEDVEIKTGFSDGRVSEVTSGLSEGDTVVVGG